MLWFENLACFGSVRKMWVTIPKYPIFLRRLCDLNYLTRNKIKFSFDTVASLIQISRLLSENFLMTVFFMIHFVHQIFHGIHMRIQIPNHILII